MSKSKTLDVEIMGRVYKVACADEEREGLLQAVGFLDERMNAIKSSGKIASAERIAVMAALNIAHEYLQLRTQPVAHPTFDSADLGRRIAAMQAALDEALVPQERLL